MKKYLVPLFILLFYVNVFAANHYIRAGTPGANDGNGWADAWTSFGNVTWTRGDTYYVAGGDYKEKVTISKPASGSTWIYIKKANAADNNRDSGWDDAYATRQAVIYGTGQNDGIEIRSSYIEIDGVTGSDNSGHGIKVNFQENCSVPLPIGCGIRIDSGVSNIFLHHMEIHTCSADSVRVARSIHQNSINSEIPTKGIHIQHCYEHDASENSNTFLGHQGTSYEDYGLLFEDNRIDHAGLNPNLKVHAQAFQFGPRSTQQYVIIRNNLISDHRGSGHISFLSGSKNHFFRIHNNVFMSSPGNSHKYLSSPGFVWSHPKPGTEVADLEFYNNAIRNIYKAQLCFVPSSGGVSRITAKNNFWIDSEFTMPHKGVTTFSDNVYRNNIGFGE